MSDFTVIDHSDEFKRKLQQALEIAMEGVGAQLEGEAKDELENDPRRVDTGHLRNSITHRVETDGNEISAIIGTNVSYAVYVHEGTGKHKVGGGGRSDPWIYKDDKGKWHVTAGMKPNRFLRNAVERNKDQSIKYIEDEVKKRMQ